MQCSNDNAYVALLWRSLHKEYTLRRLKLSFLHENMDRESVMDLANSMDLEKRESTFYIRETNSTFDGAHSEGNSFGCSLIAPHCRYER